VRIARVHASSSSGPGETADDIRETFRYAARLEIDTFGFNRLAVYRGTRSERVRARGIVDDDRTGQDLQVLRHRPGHRPNDEVTGSA